MAQVRFHQHGLQQVERWHENRLLRRVRPLVFQGIVLKFNLLVKGTVDVQFVVSRGAGQPEDVLEPAPRVLDSLHIQEVLPNAGQVLLENVEAHGVHFLVAVEQRHVCLGRILEDALQAVPPVDLGIHHLGHHVQLDPELAQLIRPIPAIKLESGDGGVDLLGALMHKALPVEHLGAHDLRFVASLVYDFEDEWLVHLIEQTGVELDLVSRMNEVLLVEVEQDNLVELHIFGRLYARSQIAPLVKGDSHINVFPLTVIFRGRR